MNHVKKLAVLLLLAPFTYSSSYAAVVYDEGVSGDLSDDNNSPTAVALGLGSNEIIGSHISNPLDRDVFTITIGAGQQLDTIILDSYTNTDDQSFFGYEEGSVITDFSAGGATFAYALIGLNAGVSLGDDLLDDLAGGSVGPGSYSFWLQETAGDVTYTLDLQVSTVPVPAAVWLFGSGLIGLVGCARRKKA